MIYLVFLPKTLSKPSVMYFEMGFFEAGSKDPVKQVTPVRSNESHLSVLFRPPGLPVNLMQILDPHTVACLLKLHLREWRVSIIPRGKPLTDITAGVREKNVSLLYIPASLSLHVHVPPYLYTFIPGGTGV